MFQGFSTVFAFTFVQHIKGKGYRVLTAVVALLCFALPAVCLAFAAYSGGEEESAARSNRVEEVLVVDLSGGNPADANLFNTIGEEDFADLTYKTVPDVETAIAQAEGHLHTLILVIQNRQDHYEYQLLRPDQTDLTEEDVSYYNVFLSSAFRLILIQKSGLDEAQIAVLSEPHVTEVMSSPLQSVTEPGEEGGEAQEEDPNEIVRMVLGLILPYVTIMVLYFMILFYGRGVSNSVILEKTSKLMDFFLVSVKPEGMMLGKVLAIALAGIVQLFCWIFCLVGGFWTGSVLANAIDPQNELALLALFESFGQFSGMFSVPGIVLAVLVLLSGFLMYCALASVGGALAGKPEDLSSTNMLFTLSLVVSFLCTLYSGVISEEAITLTVGWQYYVPFTAMLIAPSQILLGNMTPLQALLSLGIIVVTTALIVALAGKIYRMMVLYKGNPPPVWKVIGMLRSRKS